MARDNGPSLPYTWIRQTADSLGRLWGSCRTWKASPMPSQTGRWKRVCVQAKIQGMARSWSMLHGRAEAQTVSPMYTMFWQ